MLSQVVLTKDYSALASILSVTCNGKVVDYTPSMIMVGYNLSYHTRYKRSAQTTHIEHKFKFYIKKLHIENDLLLNTSE